MALKVTTRRDYEKGPDHHFFVSSAAEWRVDYDVAKLVNSFKKMGYPFNVWLVPGDISTEYRIEFYSPQVEGAVWLGAYLHEKDA